VKQGFRYPSSDEIHNDRWAMDFLREKKTYPEYTDPNYICNQRDACNYFLDWFEIDSSVGYIEMLCHQHRLAAAGISQRSLYSIYTKNGLWLKPTRQSEDRIQYSTIGNSWRDTFPGLLRSQLENDAIQHPATDILRLKRSEHNELLGLTEPSVSKHIIWERCNRNPHKRYATFKFSVNFLTATGQVAIPVNFKGSGNFIREAPRGTERDNIFAYVAETMNKIKESWAHLSRSDFILFASRYYHSAINLMPFSNINNSLFCGQINSLLRLRGMKSIPHGRLDIISMLTSPQAFNIYFHRYLNL